MSELTDKVKEMNIIAYDKGVNDALNVITEGFKALKGKGVVIMSIDNIIEAINQCRTVANKIPTTYNE